MVLSLATRCAFSAGDFTMQPSPERKAGGWAGGRAALVAYSMSAFLGHLVKGLLLLSSSLCFMTLDPSVFPYIPRESSVSILPRETGWYTGGAQV